MTVDQLQALARNVEALPMIAEVHEMGMALEDIIESASPDTPLFDFKSTPPWDLDKCVDKAVDYLNSHQAQYGVAPTPTPTAPPAAPPPAVPAAPPPTAPAPAATAAAPAGTTPAP